MRCSKEKQSPPFMYSMTRYRWSCVHAKQPEKTQRNTLNGRETRVHEDSKKVAGNNKEIIASNKEIVRHEVVVLKGNVDTQVICA